MESWTSEADHLIACAVIGLLSPTRKFIECVMAKLLPCPLPLTHGSLDSFYLSQVAAAGISSTFMHSLRFTITLLRAFTPCSIRRHDPTRSLSCHQLFLCCALPARFSGYLSLSVSSEGFDTPASPYGVLQTCLTLCEIFFRFVGRLECLDYSILANLK